MKNSINLCNVQGGCSFYKLVIEWMKTNKVDTCFLEKTYNNKKTVFVVKGKKYIIGKDSYIFNYEGYLEMEEFYGKTREINGNTISSSYSDCIDYVPTKKELIIKYDLDNEELEERERNILLSRKMSVDCYK